MKSGLWLRPMIRNDGISALVEVLTRAEDLARIYHRPVEVLMQHSLKEDKFAIMVNMGRKSLGDYGDTFRVACKKVLKVIDKFIEEDNEKQLAKKESKARAKRRQGHRRKGSKGKRGHALLQGGRKKRPRS